MESRQEEEHWEGRGPPRGLGWWWPGHQGDWSERAGTTARCHHQHAVQLQGKSRLVGVCDHRAPSRGATLRSHASKPRAAGAAQETGIVCPMVPPRADPLLSRKSKT